MEHLLVEQMALADLEVAVDWAAAEGWNPGLSDAASFWSADPGGFLVGRLDGELVATISAVRYGDDHAFLGLYIVDPAHRGKGYGRAVWDAAMVRLEGRVAGLDGVLEQEAAYRSSGFEVAWRNARHELRDPTGVAPSRRTVDLAELDRSILEASDRTVFVVARRAFLDAWLTSQGHVGRAVVGAGEELRGWGVRRPCRSGHKIGPLVADAPDVADDLFRDLVADVDGPVFLDVPDSNRAAVDLVASYSMPVCFETLRMYNGPAPGLRTSVIYGVTSLELG